MFFNGDVPGRTCRKVQASERSLFWPRALVPSSWVGAGGVSGAAEPQASLQYRAAIIVQSMRGQLLELTASLAVQPGRGPKQH